jgi:hypothetical protein
MYSIRQWFWGRVLGHSPGVLWWGCLRVLGFRSGILGASFEPHKGHGATSFAGVCVDRAWGRVANPVCLVWGCWVTSEQMFEQIVCMPIIKRHAEPCLCPKQTGACLQEACGYVLGSPSQKNSEQVVCIQAIKWQPGPCLAVRHVLGHGSMVAHSGVTRRGRVGSWSCVCSVFGRVEHVLCMGRCLY